MQIKGLIKIQLFIFLFLKFAAKKKYGERRLYNFYCCFESRNLHCKSTKLREVISDQAVLESNEGPNTGLESSPWKDRWFQARGLI